MSTAIAECADIVIETGIEVPPRKSMRDIAKRRESKYPVGKLEVGQSFWVAKEKAFSARGTASRYKKLNPGFEYTVRAEEKVNAEGIAEKGVRVFRLA